TASTMFHVVALWTTSVQVVAVSLLIWILSPAASAPLVPDTVSVVSLVMKSPAVPLSVAIAVIASASAGAVVSIVTAWLAVVPTLTAASMIRECEGTLVRDVVDVGRLQADFL